MKILPDESLPRKLKSFFGSENEVFSVKDMDWLGKKNGELLCLLIENKFEIFVTVDKNLQYQQNLARLPLTIFVLRALDNRLQTLQQLIPLIFERISEDKLQNVIEISA